MNEQMMVKKSNQLCIISLICMFVMPVVNLLISGGNGDISGATAAAWGRMITMNIAAYVVAWILAIVSRVRYKKTFSLVLIIIYGVLLGITIMGVIFLFCVFMGMF